MRLSVGPLVKSSFGEIPCVDGFRPEQSEFETPALKHVMP